MTGRGNQAAIIGVGSTPISRRCDRSIVSLGLDAALAAIADAGLTRADIDGYVGAPTSTAAGTPHVDGADELSMRLLADRLGLSDLAWGADLQGDFTTSMVTAAAHAIASGACSTVLIVRAMHNLIGLLPADIPRREFAIGEEQFEAPFGYRTGGARFALRAQDYMARSGATRRDIYEVIALARDNASRNPLAIWRTTPVSLEQYLDAPLVAEPHGLFDCDMPVCGAVAFVVTRADLAAGGPNRPVYVAGSAGWQKPETIFARAGRPREAVQFCQLYDGFSTMMFEWLERLGWCEADRGWRFIRDGHCAPDGMLPLNSFGGSLGEGRLHGAGHVREAVLQLSGRGGDRQIAGAENCLVQVGPFDFSSLLMLSSVPG